MSESFIQLPPNSTGLKAHTNQRTIGANAVEDEIVLLGEPYLPHYSLMVTGISTATINDHLVQLMSIAGVRLRIRRVLMVQANAAGANTQGRFQLLRLTTAGTGGAAFTPAPFDPANTASATAQRLPTAKGTEGTVLVQATLPFTAVAATVGGVQLVIWEQLPNQEPIIVPAGTANGIALKSIVAIASATVDVRIEFAETTW